MAVLLVLRLPHELVVALRTSDAVRRVVALELFSVGYVAGAPRVSHLVELTRCVRDSTLWPFGTSSFCAWLSCSLLVHMVPVMIASQRPYCRGLERLEGLKLLEGLERLVA